VSVFFLWFSSQGQITKCSLSECSCCRNDWLRILKLCSVTFVAILQIYLPFKTHSQLKSVILQTNCNFNWLNWNMTQFCAVVSATKLLITFYASVPVSRFSELCKLARNLSAVFVSTCVWTGFVTCQTKQIKFRSGIIDMHLHDAIRIGFSKWNRMLIFVWSRGNSKYHINKVRLGHFTVTFSSVLVTVEIFECFGPRKRLEIGQDRFLPNP
jgi:hypothetical protein